MTTYLLYFSALMLPMFLSSILFRSQVRINRNHRYFFQQRGYDYQIENGNCIGISRRNITCMFFVLLLPTLLAIFRYNCGVDYRNYTYLITEIQRRSFLESTGVLRNVEFGNWIIIKLVYGLTHSTIAVMGFYAIAIMTFLAIDMLYYRDRVDLNVLMFILLVMLYPPSYNTTRQILAATITLFGIRYIEQKKLGNFCVIIIVSSLIHISALIFLPIYFTYNTKSKISKQIGTVLSFSYLVIPAVLITLFGMLPNMPFIGRYFEVYHMSFNTDFRFDIIMRFIVYFPMLFLLRKDCKNDRRNRIYYLIMLADFSFMLLSFWYVWAFRLTYYFVFSQAYLIAYHVKAIKNAQTKFIVKTTICCFYMFVFWLLFIVWERDGIVPYTTWL